jgi:hypothetical protein
MGILVHRAGKVEGRGTMAAGEKAQGRSQSRREMGARWVCKRGLRRGEGGEEGGNPASAHDPRG